MAWSSSALRGPARALVLLLWAACGPVEDTPPPAPTNEPRTGTLTLLAPPTQDVLPGSIVRILGAGFQPDERASMRLSLTGQSQLTGPARDVQLDLPFTYVSATELQVTVDAALHRALAGGDVPTDATATLTGTLTLNFEISRSAFTRSAPISLALRSQLRPTMGGLRTRAVYLEDRLLLGGSFLLPGEGQSVVVLEGAYTRQIYSGQVGAGLQYVSYPRREFALTPLSRTQAALPIHASVFGIAPGTFSGKLTIINRHKGGAELKTDATDVELALLRTQLLTLSSTRLSRGQRIVGLGAGFLPLDPKGDTATLIRLRGTFTPAATPMGPSLPIELTLVTAVQDNDHLLFVPRPKLNEAGDALVGPFATPGRFTGSVTPLLVRAAEQLEGTGLPCGQVCALDIVPPKQVLVAKFLPNFTEGLRRFGLRNLEKEVRDQALLVARRTYAPWNVEIRDTRPDDYDEFTTMEVGGPDPNGAGLFGLDNTEGLDRGNLRLNDYIGGFNATAEVEGSFAFGGVFIESFLAFSPQSPKKITLATPLFDQIFAPFMPELGGRPADRDELVDSPRREALTEAVRALGTLVGGTLSHEFGHSLGLSLGSSGSHNDSNIDRELMNAGAFRSFAERAELGDYRTRPSGFYPKHQAYLDTILPR